MPVTHNLLSSSPAVLPGTKETKDPANPLVRTAGFGRITKSGIGTPDLKKAT